MPTAVSVFGLAPRKIGSQEAYAREVSRQLADRGWQSILCFNEYPPADVYDYLSMANVEIQVLPHSERASLATLAQLAKILRRSRAQLLHLHYTEFLSPYPWLAMLVGVRRIYYTDHISRPEGHTLARAPLWKRFATRLINLPLDAVVSVSRYGQDCIAVRDVLPPERLVQIYNGVDLVAACSSPEISEQFRRRFAIPDNRLVVTQVCWMIPEKGVCDLLHAARLVLTEHPRAHFVLVGEGPELEHYRALAATLGLDGRVTWTGRVQDPLRDGVFAASDVVCQVSRWNEIFGLAIAEAMACGRPVVATRVGGIPELVDDGTTGYLVPRGDVAAIAGQIGRLLLESSLRHDLGKAGAHRAEKMFDLRLNVAAILRLYGFSDLPASATLQGANAFRDS